MCVFGEIVTTAPPPSCAARTSRIVSVSLGATPESTTRRNPPERSSSSAARTPCMGLSGRTSNGPSVQNAPAMVRAPSIHAARSPAVMVVSHAARSIAVTPPVGSHTESIASGNPPCGNARSRSPMPVATGCVVRRAAGVASGNRCSMRARRVATDTTGSEKRERSEGRKTYTEQIPKTRVRDEASLPLYGR